MKKFLSLFLALVMVLALAVPVLAAPPSTNANRNPGTYVVTADDITVRIGGNGNSARLIAYVDGGQYAVFARPDNNRYNIISVAGFELGVFVRGNSILRVSVISGPPPSVDEPYVVEEYSVRQFVRFDEADSIFEGTSEVVDSRIVTDLTATLNVIRQNFTQLPGSAATGMGVIVRGFSAGGTLNYEYVRNYLEQFESVYVWVDVTVWSNGDRDEVVRLGSEHVYGNLVDGVEYSTGPFDGSREISVDAVGEVRLCMGKGQGYGRYGSLTSAGITVNFTLGDTGNPPTFDAISPSVSNINAL